MNGQPPTAPPVSATIHIYRGLMDRARTWRSRIDQPTNWAITTAGATVSFVVSDPEHSHAVLLVMMLLTFAFLIIEARRFRYYDLWGSWVRVLETEFLASVLTNNNVAIDQPWERLLLRDFAEPLFKTSMIQLIARRLRDVYGVLFALLLSCWLLKLLIHQPVDQGIMSSTLIGRAAIGPVPGWLVTSFVVVGYSALVFIMLFWRGQSPAVEVLDRERLLLYISSPTQRPMSRRQSQPAMLARFLSEADDQPLEQQDWD